MSHRPAPQTHTDADAGTAKPTRAMVTTSWDDGHPQDLRLADLLETHGVPATLYIPREDQLGSRPVISEEQIRALSKRGFEIGAHTLHHAVLTDASAKTAEREITDSGRWVADVIGRACAMFCPPCGKHARQHVDMIRAAGYRGYRTVELWSTDQPRQHDGLLEMPTSIQAQPQPAASVLRNLLKRRAASNLWSYIKLGRTGNWTQHAAAMLDRAIDTGGVFHLWGHSWELEDEGQWDRLDQVLGVLNRYRDRADFATNAEVCARYAATQTDGSSQPATA